MSLNLKNFEMSIDKNEGGNFDQKYSTCYNNNKGFKDYPKDDIESDNNRFNFTQINSNCTKFLNNQKNKYDTISYGNFNNFDLTSQNKIASDLRRKFLEFQRKTYSINKLETFDKANRTYNKFGKSKNYNIKNTNPNSKYATIDNFHKQEDCKKFYTWYPSSKKQEFASLNSHEIVNNISGDSNHFLSKSPSDFVNRPQHNQFRVIRKVNNSKNAAEQTMYKKLLKGRLLKIISDSIVLKKYEIESYKNKKNDFPTKTQQEYLIKYRNEKHLGIITGKNSEFFPSKDFPITSRCEDLYLTPNELLLKHFTENELKIIKSDPIYFHLNKGAFKDVTLLKNKTLLETLDEEERKIEIRRKVMTRNNAMFDFKINNSLSNLNEGHSNSNRSESNEFHVTNGTNKVLAVKSMSKTRSIKKSEVIRTPSYNSENLKGQNNSIIGKQHEVIEKEIPKSLKKQNMSDSSKMMQANRNSINIKESKIIREKKPYRGEPKSPIKNEKIRNINNSSDENQKLSLYGQNKNLAYDNSKLKINKSEKKFAVLQNLNPKLKLDPLYQLNGFNDQISENITKFLDLKRNPNNENKLGLKLDKNILSNIISQNPHNKLEKNPEEIKQNYIINAIRRFSKMNKLKIQEEAIWTDKYVNRIKENYLSSNKKH